MVDSYVYKKFSTGTPPVGPQVTAAGSNRKITATDNANHTNFGGVYGHTLTYSEPGSNDLAIITAADPTGLLVATPVEGDPSRVSIREYKCGTGYVAKGHNLKFASIQLHYCGLSVRTLALRVARTGFTQG